MSILRMVALAIAITPAHQCYAEATLQQDVKAEINKKLSFLMDYTIGVTAPLIQGGALIKGKLTVNNADIKIVRSNLTASEPKWDELPYAYLKFRDEYHNCSSLEQSYAFEHLDQIKTGTRVSNTKTINTGKDESAELSFTFTHVAGKISVKFSNSISISSYSEQSYEKMQSLKYTVPVKVKSGTVLSFEHTWIVQEVAVPYNGTVVVDANLDQACWNMIPNTPTCLANLSEVFPDETDRTFRVAGTATTGIVVENRETAIETPDKVCK